MLLWIFACKFLFQYLFSIWGYTSRRKIAGLYDNSMFNLLWNCSPLFIDFQTHEAGKNLKSDLEQCSSDLWISHISKITIRMKASSVKWIYLVSGKLIVLYLFFSSHLHYWAIWEPFAWSIPHSKSEFPSPAALSLTSLWGPIWRMPPLPSSPGPWNVLSHEELALFPGSPQYLCSTLCGLTDLTGLIQPASGLGLTPLSPPQRLYRAEHTDVRS